MREQIMSFIDASRLFTAAWKLYKKYALRKLDEKEAEVFIQEIHSVYEKYSSSPFAKEILLAVINEIDRRGGYFEN